MARVCTVADCDRPHNSHGLCRRCLYRLQRYGTLTPTFFRHGTTEGWTHGCRCDKCARAYRVWRRVTDRFPSTRDPAAALTDPNRPGFWRLAADVFPDHVRAGIRERAERRWQLDLEAATSRAALEIMRMEFWEIEELMVSEIPSVAQTRRRLPRSA